MESRRIIPLIAAVGLVAATIGGVLVFGGPGVLDRDGAGAAPPPASPIADADTDGTYGCSPIGDDAAPRLSAPAGFHDAAFDLELTGPDGTTVHYTLDGSLPDPVHNASSTSVYEGPITIDTNDGPFPLSAMRTAFDRGALAGGNASPKVWDLSQAPVPGGVVVRARAFDDAVLDGDDEDRVETAAGRPDDGSGNGDASEGGGDDGPPVTADAGDGEVPAECVGVFFVGSGLVRQDLPVVHLTTDPDHLIDHDTGIYTPGAIYSEWLNGDDYDPEGEHQFGLVPANYRERGRDWERPAENDLGNAVSMHHFEPGGELSFATNLGMRVHGGWTRAFPAKSLRLYARNDYGSRTFDHAFFGDRGPDQHRRLILRNSGNDWEWTMLLDGYVQSLVDHLDVETQAYQPTALFINGEYWGVHNLRERYDHHYLEIAHGVDPDDVAIVGGYGSCCEVNTGEPEDDEPYIDFLHELRDLDPNDDATLDLLTSQFDVDDLIDYLTIQLYVSNTDWPQNNLKLWREKVDPDPELGTARDGRWRWLVYDLDFVGDMRRDPLHDPFRRLADMRRGASGILADMGIPFLFDHLTQNDDFRARFATRFADQTNTSFRAERTTAELDELVDLVSSEMARHILRWGDSSRSNWWPADSVGTWQSRVGEVRRFFAERPGIALHHASEALDLGGTTTLEITTSGTDTGWVQVNTIDLLETTPGVADPADWSGEYFAGVPVTLRATPADGHRFVRWDGAPDDATSSTDGDTEVLVLDLDADAATTVAAVFEPA